MNTTTNLELDSREWCGLASQWLNRHGLGVLDPVQRRRFGQHASTCSACAPVAGAEEDPSIAHLSEATIVAVAQGTLSAEEVALVREHTALCDFCAWRVDVARDDGDDEIALKSDLLARSRLTPVGWQQDDTGILAWRSDTPLAPNSHWTVRLFCSDARCTATLVFCADPLLLARWSRLVVTLSQSDFFRTIVFVPDRLKVEFAVPEESRRTWNATALLHGEQPSWSVVVSPGQARDDLRPAGPNAPFSFVLPCDGVRSPDAWRSLVKGLGDLFEDARGDVLVAEMLTDGVNPSEAVLRTKSGELVGGVYIAALTDGVRFNVVPVGQEISFWLAEDIEAELSAASLAGSAVSQEVRTAIPAAGSSKAATAWNEVLVWFRRAKAAPKHWTMDTLGWLTRTLELGVVPSQPARALGGVLGRETRVREVDLLQLLEELQVAAYFTSFKLVVQSGVRTQASAVLVPRDVLPGPDQYPMRFQLQFLRDDGTPIRHGPLIADPVGKPTFVSVPGIEADRLTGRIQVTVKEIPALVNGDDHDHSDDDR